MNNPPGPDPVPGNSPDPAEKASMHVEPGNRAFMGLVNYSPPDPDRTFPSGS